MESVDPKMKKIEENESKQITHTQKIICFLIVIVVLTITNQISFHDTTKGREKCNIDKFLDLTENLNKVARENENFRNFLMVISSFLIDMSVIATGVCWILYSKTWRPLISIGMFYLFRGIINASFAMKYPENMIWEYPGIPSFSVSYHKTSDFFFSGHVGINLIAAIELYRYGMTKISFLSFFGIFFQIFTMIVLRGHYSIDLIAGLISAHYCDLISFKIVSCFDYFINLDENERRIFFVDRKIINN